jgi:hypothetical protein
VGAVLAVQITHWGDFAVMCKISCLSSFYNSNKTN